MRSHSIRRTLLFRCGVGVGALLCLLSVTTYLLAKRSLNHETNQSINETAALLANELELENDAVAYEWQEGLGSNNSLKLKELFQFWDDRAGTTSRSPALGTSNLPKFQGVDGKPLIKDIILPNGHHGRAVGLRIHPFVLPEEVEKMHARGSIAGPDTFPHTLVVAQDIEPMQRTLSRLRLVLGSGTLLTLTLGFALIYHAIRVAMRPIDELTLEMDERAGHQLDSALNMPENMPSELAGLAKNFDALLTRVSAMRQRERDFIRHAAHELRTPIAGLRATTELALSQSRGAAAYAKHLKTCRNSAEELAELVKRLSALAHIDQSQQATINPESFTARELLEECLAHFIPVFENRGVTLATEDLDSSLLVTADRTLSRIVLNNLLDNAASYTPAGGTVKIQCKRPGRHVHIIISNPATGLPEDLDRLFEPLFHRVNTTGDSSSHLGIGLTLSLEAAAAMHCSLRARRTDGGRIEFDFALPASAEMMAVPAS